MTSDHPAFRPARLVLVVAFLLMIPLLAMQFTNEVTWSPFDFAVAGALLFGAGLAYELVASRGRTFAYRAAAGLAVGTALFLVWANLAVGLIGSENNPANWMYVGVIAIEAIGAVVARFRPAGMARAMFVTAGAVAVVGVIALALGLGGAESPPAEIIGVNAMFMALFGGAGLLFLRAAREQPGTAARS